MIISLVLAVCVLVPVNCAYIGPNIRSDAVRPRSLAHKYDSRLHQVEHYIKALIPALENLLGLISDPSELTQTNITDEKEARGPFEEQYESELTQANITDEKKAKDLFEEQYEPLISLQCKAIPMKVKVSTFLAESDNGMFINHETRYAGIVGCVEECSYCEEDGFQCLPVESSRKQRTIMLHKYDIYGHVFPCTLTITEFTECSCKNLNTYTYPDIAKEGCKPIY